MWRIRSFWKIQIEPPVPSQRRKRLIEDRIEYRRKITGRGVDNLEHLGGRGLLFQGFAGLVDEPRILHRYDGLGGETFEQRDLFFRERSHFLAIGYDSTEQRSLFAQWNCKNAARAAQFDIRPAWMVRCDSFSFGARVGDVNEALAAVQVIRCGPWTNLAGSSKILCKCRGHVV